MALVYKAVLPVIFQLALRCIVVLGQGPYLWCFELVDYQKRHRSYFHSTPFCTYLRIEPNGQRRMKVSAGVNHFRFRQSSVRPPT